MAPSDNDIDILHKKIAALSKRLQRFENVTAPTIPVYDVTTPNFPQDAVEGQICLGDNKTAWAYTEADGWWEIGGGAGATGSFSDAVTSLPHLRGYWRLGEDTPGPFADTAGYAFGPYPMDLNAGAEAALYQQTGLIGADQDDGAINFQSTGLRASTDWLNSTGGSDFIVDGHNLGYSIAAWVAPASMITDSRGGIVACMALAGSSPTHEEGIVLDATWTSSGGTITIRSRRGNSGGYDSAEQIVAADTGVLVVTTYNGSDILLYINGMLVDSVASTRTLDSNPGAIAIGYVQYDDISFGPSAAGFTGIIDEVAFYCGAGSALNPTQVATLYAGGLA